MKVNKRKIAIWGGAVAAVLLLLVLGIFIFRQRLLDYVVNKTIAKVEARYPAKLSIGKAEFADLNTVQMNNIALVPNGRDTLLRTDTVYATVGLKSLFKGRVVFKDLHVADGYLTLVKRNGQDNFSFLYKKEKPEKQDTTAGRNYGKLLNQLIETAFENVPDKVSFRNLNVSYQSNNRRVGVNMPALHVEDGRIETSLVLQTDSLTNRMRVSGEIDPGDYRISGRLYTEDTTGIVLPYLKQKFGGTLAFDTLQFSLTDKTFRNNVLTIEGQSRVHNLVVNHPRIADEDIKVRSGSVNYKLSVGENYVSVDSLTKVTVNKLTFYPQASYVSRPSKQISLKVQTAQTLANDFFASLPEGMFETFEGIQAEGALSYKMNFFVDMAQIDSLKFDSDLEGHDFRIVKYGVTDFSKINNSFQHTVYEYGKPVRTFTVGPENPFFSRLNEVSPYLKNAILTSEDAGFWKHKGFHEEAFRLSLVTNIKQRKFARGGSTISMQLVKNVFLTRKKTIARKVEEALIVWLIENNNIVSKARMMEVYLNIIEWGPNVYGVKDASRFFFGKQPSELGLAESLYLTSIIPRPKAYKYSFDEYGNLKKHKAWYFRFISGIMLRRGLITQEDYDNLTPHVNLYGRARDLIITATDTTQQEDEPDSLQFMLQPRDLLE